VTPDVSVIVLNYNGRRWLPECLGALGRQVDAPAHEVLLVDNGSSDGSVDLVKIGFPSVRIVSTGSNVGFAAGNNAGAHAARGKYLAFLNNDTVPADDWLQQLFRAHVDGPGRSLVTSRIVFLDRPDVIDSAGDGYLRAGGAFKRGHGESARAFDVSREVFGACGAALSISKDLFERLGGFDERFFMVYEDVDLSYRARLMGHRCWYAAGACVRHAGSATLGRASDTAVYYGQRNLEWTWAKNTPASLLLRTLPAHVAYSLAGIAHYIARGKGGAVIRGKIAALAGLPMLLRDRRNVQQTRTVGIADLRSAMTGGWLTQKRREKSARLDLADHQNGRVA
jgi:GT2 family glycosyltransferase